MPLLDGPSPVPAVRRAPPRPSTIDSAERVRGPPGAARGRGGRSRGFQGRRENAPFSRAAQRASLELVAGRARLEWERRVAKASFEAVGGQAALGATGVRGAEGAPKPRGRHTVPTDSPTGSQRVQGRRRAAVLRSADVTSHRPFANVSSTSRRSLKAQRRCDQAPRHAPTCPTPPRPGPPRPRPVPPRFFPLSSPYFFVFYCWNDSQETNTFTPASW